MSSQAVAHAAAWFAFGKGWKCGNNDNNNPDDGYEVHIPEASTDRLFY